MSIQQRARDIARSGVDRSPVTRHWSRFFVTALLLVAPFATAQDIKDGGPYVPTPQKVVDSMLDLAGVRAKDYVIDLGSGDGRIVLTAATRHKARGMGVDIDQELVDRAKASAQRLGIADRVQFVKQDVHKADLSQATVLTLYLLPAMMVSLRPKLLKELRPGTRIVSHDFDFAEWKPDRTVEIDTPEKYDIAGAWTSNVYLWVVPAAVQGAWRGSFSGANAKRFQLDINQEFQRIEGKLTRNGREVTLREGKVEGAQVRFAVPHENGGGMEQVVATVKGDRMTGELRGNNGAVTSWTASREPRP